MILACLVTVISHGYMSDGLSAITPSYTANSSCAVYRTIKEAALEEYESGRLSQAEFYRIDMDALKVEKIKTPTVKKTLEVKE